MFKLLIATRNPGKLAEFRKFLSDPSVETVSLQELDINDEFEEHGKTFAENAREKARFFAKRSGVHTLADDGGLEIDVLKGEPGVRSRRWPGKEASDEELVVYCLKRLEGFPPDQRRARLATAIAVVDPAGTVIAETQKSTGGVLSTKLEAAIMPGYPYRSLLMPDGVPGKCYASLTPEEERSVYHRLHAVEAIRPALQSLIAQS